MGKQGQFLRYHSVRNNNEGTALIMLWRGYVVALHGPATRVRPALMRGQDTRRAVAPSRRRGRAANSLAFASSDRAALTAASMLLAAREIARDEPEWPDRVK